MSGGFKWLECGDWQVIVDADDGRILAYVVKGFPTQPQRAVPAFVDGKPIGVYLSAEFARAAVEEAMGSRVRNGLQNSGRAIPMLPMDERAWLEDQPSPSAASGERQEGK